MRYTTLIALQLVALHAQTPPLSSAVMPFVRVHEPVVALVHARVIDGSDSNPVEDQTIILADGLIRTVGPASLVAIPSEAKQIDLTGMTVIPGLVGMHDHLFYPVQPWDFKQPPLLYGEMGFSFPRLYLAAGVTTIRTAGSMEPYADLALKRLVDEGKMPGPKMHITSPYIEGKGAFAPQIHELSGPEDARRTVEYWIAEGVTSLKAYTNITRDELKETIQAAHAHGLKVTGHLCSIGFREAAELGIDNLEHGLLTDSEFVSNKKPDVCPPFETQAASLRQLDVASAPVQAMIHDLVQHQVAITSTLALYESFTPSLPPLDKISVSLSLLAPRPLKDYLNFRHGLTMEPDISTARLKKEMEFERQFVRAGGLLLAGLDPNGGGGLLAGLGDQREVELLVQAGFTPVQAIHIATMNGATFLGEAGQIGSISAGKAADIVVLRGNPAKHIEEIEKVEIVFKDGVGYSPAKLIESVRGEVGRH